MDNVIQNRARSFLRQLHSQDTWRKLRGLLSQRKISIVLIVLGLVLFCYVGSQYASMYREQQALHQQWQQQQTSSPDGAIAEAVSKSDGLTRVLIPKIDLDVIVVEGYKSQSVAARPRPPSGHSSSRRSG